MEANKKRVLIVEDEKNIADVIKAYLEKEKYEAIVTHNGKEAIDIFQQQSFDFVILDLMLPGLSGEEICNRIRLQSDVPILMLTAKVEETDQIHGLDIGADDYMTKPFSPKELMARVRAIMRRTSNEGVRAHLIELNGGDLKVDIRGMETRKKGELMDLTATEFKLLSIFIQNSGKVFSREELVLKVLGYDYVGYDRTIDVHIKNVRHKIECEQYKYIVTVYGVGYRFVKVST
ncbi:two component transcriptional regulator, winged helix family [Alkaliphilus metalliredigens QYMF]|uniref:Stage 0 sporulation protein A homolog n=1 Tax=Alkaliphilus metalliredigens (strain QYMF) TaxID=293826 RepID=A6TM92_ALKMQ|nr:response regulator transcription factor [Alkaliphilus metalliredigens]ABR47310.1 two component transcriptional regulator, winged helix family [Alkaliphilus metalliredigens QYMF]